METYSALLILYAGIHRSPVNSLHKGQWHRALMFSLISAWINGWANNHEAGDFRRHYDVTVMNLEIPLMIFQLHVKNLQSTLIVVICFWSTEPSVMVTIHNSFGNWWTRQPLCQEWLQGAYKICQIFFKWITLMEPSHHLNYCGMHFLNTLTSFGTLKYILVLKMHYTFYVSKNDAPNY